MDSTRACGWCPQAEEAKEARQARLGLSPAGGTGADAVASATAVVSELLTDFLDSLAAPPIPRSLRDTALSAAALSDTETLLSLPTKLPKAHAGVFSELVALASTVLQALEDKDASAPGSEPGTPGAQGP